MIPSSLRFGTILLALLSAAAAPPPRVLVARVDVGETIEAATLPTLAGGTEPLTSRTAKVNVVLFWRPDQAYSLDTLKQMSQCEKIFAGKPIHMVAVVSGTYPRADVQKAVDDAALHVPVLIDQGDELYGKLGVRQHPLVVVADAGGKVALSQPYLRLNYCDIVHAYVRNLLGEISIAQRDAIVNPQRAAMPDDDKNNIARRFVKMGKMQADSGDCAGALSSFKKALEIAPDNKDALAGVAACEGGKPHAQR